MTRRSPDQLESSPLGNGVINSILARRPELTFEMVQEIDRALREQGYSYKQREERIGSASVDDLPVLNSVAASSFLASLFRR
jgi:hypothetical protein